MRLVTQIVAPSCARSKGAMGKTFEIADMPALTLEMHHKLRLLERDLRLALDDCDGIFAGPIKTLTACSVGHPSEMLRFHTDRAPPHRSVDFSQLHLQRRHRRSHLRRIRPQSHGDLAGYPDLSSLRRSLGRERTCPARLKRARTLCGAFRV